MSSFDKALKTHFTRYAVWTAAFGDYKSEMVIGEKHIAKLREPNENEYEVRIGSYFPIAISAPGYAGRVVLHDGDPKPSAVSVRASCMNCKTCNMHNEYAEPNQDDGGYLCYECR